MEVLHTPSESRSFVRSLRMQNRSIALIPTMGALHDGHLSLVRLGLEHAQTAIATIFVNPTQFAAGEDLDRYPRTLQDDLRGLAAAGAAAVFVPDAGSMYPPGFATYVQPGDVASPLEGEFRPGHFRGVATVVMKLFQILPATHAVFGRKDYQQLRVIRRMVQDLDVDIEIIDAPIVRDPDGLAMSSRNRYLTPSQRNTALRLSAGLRAVRTALHEGQNDPDALQSILRRTLSHADGSSAPVDAIDYAVVRHRDTLLPVTRVDHDSVALVAARVGTTRLIDNESLR